MSGLYTINKKVHVLCNKPNVPSLQTLLITKKEKIGVDYEVSFLLVDGRVDDSDGKLLLFQTGMGFFFLNRKRKWSSNPQFFLE